MAEIEVTGARRSIWPWVLGLLAVGLLAAALVSLASDTSEDTVPGRDTTAVPATGA